MHWEKQKVGGGSMLEYNQNQSILDLYTLFCLGFEVAGHTASQPTLRDPMGLTKMNFVIFQVY